MSTVPRNFRPGPFDYHEEVELRVESLTNLGVGLARTGEGWVVMVPFGLPGERVRARVFRNHANYSEADLLEVLEASPERVKPECPLFGECGGCQYQHLAVEAQRRWKREQVADLFERLGGLRHPVEATVGTGHVYGYRSKLTPHHEKWRPEGPNPIGFLHHSQRSRLVDVPSCPIARPAVNRKLEEVRAHLLGGKGPKGRRRGATLLLREGMEGVATDPGDLISERVGDKVYQFRAGEFFQNNPHILPAFVDDVVGQAAGGEERWVLDIYCGVGLFGLAAASRFEGVLGVEVSAAAVTLAESNAALNGIRNARFFVGDATDLFARVGSPATETVAVIDPPRRGCDPEFLRQLVAYGPARLVYVSCDPATQARDSALLVREGYQLLRLQPFDLFPQTRHIENVATFVRG